MVVVFGVEFEACSRALLLIATGEVDGVLVFWFEFVVVVIDRF